MPVDERTSNTDRDGFVAAYQEAFGGPPYFESYTQDEVLKEIWHPHRQDGIIVLALNDSRMIGFGCAVPIANAPAEVSSFLATRSQDGTFPVPIDRAWYMSELGVVKSHRGRGIGYTLIRRRLHTISGLGDTHYVFRTAAMGSNSIHLYRKVGATEIPEAQDVSASEQVKVNSSQSTDRIYLYGDCASALQKLSTL